MFQDVVIVIPAYEPYDRLLELLKNIRDKENQMFDIILVDDGSGADFAPLFAIAQSNYACHLQRHADNKGKGRALKTAISYILDNFPNAKGIVTIDSDGQHTYEDMMKCLAEFLQHPDSLVLGVRTFEKSVPLRSKFGNLLTRDVLGAMTGMNVSDTQTGLRVIPMSWLPKLLTVEGERYEFEMNMLLEAKEDNILICEVGIATIYLDENQSSHFDAIRDSIRIYKVFLTLASILARAISSVVNFTLNHKVVFKRGQSNSAIKYFTLVVVQIVLSSLLVTVLGNALTTLPISLVKILVDGTLFFVSYFVQKHLIFSGGENED